MILFQIKQIQLYKNNLHKLLQYSNSLKELEHIKIDGDNLVIKKKNHNFIQSWEE